MRCEGGGVAGLPGRKRLRRLIGTGCLCLMLGGGPAASFEATLVAPGASDELKERLSNASAVLAAESLGRVSVHELLAAARSDYRTLVQVLYDQGHFSPVVHVLLDGREAAYVKPLDLPSSINRIEIRVEPGPPFRFGQARMAPLAPGTELPEDFAPGRPASTAVLEEAGIAGIRGWRFQGHPKARLGRQRIVAHHSEAKLDADIELLPGPQLRFGQMHVSGQTAVREGSIRRIAGFPTGEIYHPDTVQKVGTRLRRTGTFSSVTLRERDAPNPDGSLDFDAEFQDLPPRRISFGGSLSSRTGLELSVSWMHRNLWHGAERLQLDARIRNIGGQEDLEGRIGFRLERPDRFGPDDSQFYTGELETRDRTNYQVQRGVLGVGVRRYFSDRVRGDASIGLAYSNSDDAYGSNRKFRYLVFPIRMEWDRRDNKVSASGGTYLAGGLIPFIGFSGSDSGGQVTADARAYWSLGESDRFVLAGRVQVGSVLGASVRNVTPELLFFSGGAGTVRGQPYESLGLPVGAAVGGGRSFLGLSAELRAKVTEKISVVGFYDSGAIDDKVFVTSLAERHSGAGLGLRYDVGGLGPVRLDLAWPVGGTTGKGVQFYLGIGQAF